MKISHVTLSAYAALLLSTPAQAQLFAGDSSIAPATIVAYEHNSYLTTLRGDGTAAHPLGMYHMLNADIKFTSDYTKLDETTRAQFAADLHSFVAITGGGWLNFAACQRWHFIPYSKQSDYARQWFYANCPQYRNVGLFYRDAFLFEAIADATNSYNRAEMYALNDATTTHYTYCESALGAITRRQ